MELHEQNDSELVIQLQADDESAFEELMRRYKLPVVNFCYRLLGNAADADEVAQEAFVRLYQHRAEIRADAKFSTWLFALARNASIDRLRWRQRHPAESLEESPDLPDRADVAKTAANRELEAAIASAIGRLPEDQRTAIVLSEYHDLSYAEIAVVMKCSEKSVESRLYRAKQALRGELKKWLG